MIILCENNAFQNIQKCLDGICTYDNVFEENRHHQIEDLLQFCIQIVFHEKINIAGNVPESIIADSKIIIDELKKYSITDVFSIEPFGSADSNEKVIKDREEKILEAVLCELEDSLDDYLLFCFRHKNDNPDVFWKFFPNLNDGHVKLVGQVTDAIANKNKDFFVGVAGLAATQNDGGLLKIFCTPTVLEKIITFADDDENGHGDWNITMTLCLMVKFRNLLNQTFANQNRQRLAPSVVRGRSALKEQLIYSKIEDIFTSVARLTMKDIASDNAPEFADIGSVNIPSLKHYLINKGRGNVESIFKETAELRERFSCVRKYLKTKKDQDVFQGWWLGLNEIAQEVSSKIRGLDDRSTKPVPVSANYPVLHIPYTCISVPIPPLKCWKFWLLPQKWKKEASVQAFTEVIWNMLDEQDDCVRRLIKYCSRNSNG